MRTEHRDANSCFLTIITAKREGYLADELTVIEYAAPLRILRSPA